MLDAAGLVKSVSLDISNLCLIENQDDECWEIREKNMFSDGCQDGDRLVAKFYCAPELACLLLNLVKNANKRN